MIVKVAVRSPQGWAAKQIAYIQTLQNIHLQKMAEETEKIIKEYISSGIKDTQNSTGKLESYFYAKPFDDGSGWGIGEIDELNNKVKYWYVQNVGSDCNFIPTRRVRGKDGTWFIPKKGIQAKNFIERTIAEIPPLIQRVLREQ
jgi:hypothetical protein